MLFRERVTTMTPTKPLQDLMSEHFPEQAWVVDRLIAASSITMLSGAPASYKTYAALEMALAVAGGKQFLGQFDTEPGAVMVVDQENGERLLQQMLKQLHADADLPIHFYSSQGFVLNNLYVDHKLAECEENDVKLLIIDSYVRVRIGDENSPSDTAEAFKFLKRFANNGVAVLVIHHNRKPGANGFTGGYGNEMRGSSDLLAAPDSHLALVRNDYKLTFHQTKQRYARELAPFEVWVEANDDNLKFQYVGTIKKVDKELVIKEGVKSLLREHGQMLQREILEKLPEVGVKTNEHKLQPLLPAMKLDGDITDIPGSGNGTYWLLVHNVDKEDS